MKLVAALPLSRGLGHLNRCEMEDSQKCMCTPVTTDVDDRPRSEIIRTTSSRQKTARLRTSNKRRLENLSVCTLVLSYSGIKEEGWWKQRDRLHKTECQRAVAVLHLWEAPEARPGGELRPSDASISKEFIFRGAQLA